MSSLPGIIGGASQLTSISYASVITGVVEPDDELGKWIDAEDEGLSQYLDCLITSRYERDPHMWMAGITSPSGFQGASVAFFRMASPTLLWIADWTVMRANKQPDIPNSSLTDTNWVLLFDSVEPARIAVANDGVTPLYRISGVYIYGHKKPGGTAAGNAVFPLPPFLSDTFPAGRMVPSASLKQNIINATASTNVAAGLTASSP